MRAVSLIGRMRIDSLDRQKPARSRQSEVAADRVEQPAAMRDRKRVSDTAGAKIGLHKYAGTDILGYLLKAGALMPTQPRSRGTELHSRAVAMLTRDQQQPLNEIEARKLKNDLDSHLQSVPNDYQGRAALGLYYTIQYDSRALNIFESLIRECPEDSTLRLNASSAFLRLGYPKRALTELNKHRELKQIDQTTLEHFIVCALMNGDFRQARQCLDQWDNEYNQKTLHSESVENLEHIAAQYPDMDLSALGDAVAQAIQAAIDFGEPTKLGDIKLCQDEHDIWLALSVVISADIGRVLELEDALTERLIGTDIPERLAGRALVTIEKEKTTQAA